MKLLIEQALCLLIRYTTLAPDVQVIQAEVIEVPAGRGGNPFAKSAFDSVSAFERE
jgi:hypothetical protein